MIQELINNAFSYGIGGRFSFVLTMHTILGETKRFYFHEARVQEWKVSIWEPNQFAANPKKMTIVSKSGLCLEYAEGLGLLIKNPNRLFPLRNGHRSVTYSQSRIEREIAFVRV